MVEAASHARRLERDLVGKAVRDVENRAHGLTERVRHPTASDVSDGVLQGRARAALGRVVSHPGAIEIAVRDGRAVLRGAILEHEAREALRCIAKIAGIHDVIDRLERHAGPDVPALQGERRKRRERREWSPAIQIGVMGGGLALAAYGLVRGGIIGKAIAFGGGALALRGVFNRPLRGGVMVRKTITVYAPIHEVFDLWTKPETFPRFMEHVRDVDVAGSFTHWTVDGPAGAPVAFTSKVTRLEPDRVIAWCTLPEQAIEHEGQVRFEEIDGGTRVTVQMWYQPPGGLVGHTVAQLLGWDPKHRMDDDLVRMKALLEDGRTRAHRARVKMEDLH